jgi:uncharacterized protein (TIGR03382 family)
MRILVFVFAIAATLRVYPQGTLVFHNRGLTDPANGAAYDAPIGGYCPGDTAQLFLVSRNGALTPLFPTQTFRNPPNNRFFPAPVLVTVPGVPAGIAGVQMRVRVYRGDSYDTAIIRGESGNITLGPLGGIPSNGGPPITPPDLGGAAPGQGLQWLTPISVNPCVPEPSTFTLGLLGAAALLFRRR